MNKLFGTERMIDALNINPNQNPEDIIKTVHESVNKYVGDPSSSMTLR